MQTKKRNCIVVVCCWLFCSCCYLNVAVPVSNSLFIISFLLQKSLLQHSILYVSYLRLLVRHSKGIRRISYFISMHLFAIISTSERGARRIFEFMGPRRVAKGGERRAGRYRENITIKKQISIAWHSLVGCWFGRCFCCRSVGGRLVVAN